MLCCKRSSSKINNLQPYEYRLYLLDAIRQLIDERRFSEAKKKYNELRKVMDVDLTPKNGHCLQLPNLLEDDYVVERHAHIELHRLEDALNSNKLYKINIHCSVLRQMFGLPADDEVLNQIHHENTITLKMIKKTDRQHLTLYDCNLLMAENLKMCYRIIRSCHELRKVELQYCRIDDRTMGILLKVLARLPEFVFLGLKGNNLTTESITRLQEFLEDRENFPRLMWIDVSVNAVNTLPKTLIEHLVSRWPRWVRKNAPSKNVKLSPLDIIQGRIPHISLTDK